GRAVAPTAAGAVAREREVEAAFAGARVDGRGARAPGGVALDAVAQAQVVAGFGGLHRAREHDAVVGDRDRQLFVADAVEAAPSQPGFARGHWHPGTVARRSRRARRAPVARLVESPHRRPRA